MKKTLLAAAVTAAMAAGLYRLRRRAAIPGQADPLRPARLARRRNGRDGAQARERP